MDLFFLSAQVPLTKTFTRAADGGIEKSPYPLVRNFTSYSEVVDTPEQFCDVVQRHAAQGHCLLKGTLSQSLVNESRAGSTNPHEATEWICFDLDNIKGVDTVDAFVFQMLPKQFHDVDYVLQYSASAGVTSDTGLRAHLFFLLDKPASPELLKLYVGSLNFDITLLNDQLELNASGVALRYPLDRTVNQNDKLIYIASPLLGPGVADSLGAQQRIQLQKRSRSRLAFDWSTVRSQAQMDALTLKRVTELRKAVGLKKREVKYRFLPGGERLMTNPDEARVTGERKGRGFVYLNVNGGDSWGYYYPEGNPRYLHNFKGEPLVAIADFLPEYWAQIQQDLAGSWQGPRPFVFRNAATNTLFSGVWDPVNERIENDGPHQITRDNLKDFFAQHELSVPDPIEDWSFEFNPGNKRVIDFANKFCNRWVPSETMKLAKDTTDVPPTIDKVIRSILADNQECYTHFLNWLAYVYQTRQKTMTAWVLHGVEGTGKGVFYSNVLMPIFGRKHVIVKQIGSIEDRFNADLEQCLFFILDEARVEDSASAKRTLNKIKHMITEPMQEVRGMRANAYQAPSYSNFMFYSNDYDALSISTTDRRFNVAPRQENKIDLTQTDIDAIKDELLQFAGFLSAYKVDEQKARTPLNNAAKSALREAGQDTVEQLCQAVADGNLEYFMSELVDGFSGGDLIAWTNYQSALRRWLDGANTQSVTRLSDIQAAYEYLVAAGRSGMGRKKFARMLAHKNLVNAVHRCSVAKKLVRGYRVEWKATEEQLAEWVLLLTPQAKQPIDSSVSVGPWTPSLSKSA